MSDVQPDIYIDTMAAEHVQEYEPGSFPEVVFLRHDECFPSLCAVCSACGMHIADDAEAWECRRCGPLKLADEEPRESR